MPSILIVIGGQTFSNKTINDCWILLVDEKLWTKVLSATFFIFVIEVIKFLLMMLICQATL